MREGGEGKDGRSQKLPEREGKKQEEKEEGKST